MDAGLLDRRAWLYHRALTRDTTTGEQIESWPTPYASVWAEKRDLRSREFLAARSVNAELTTTFRIRHNPDVLMTDRIVYAGKSYAINAIAEIGRRDGLEIQAAALLL